MTERETIDIKRRLDIFVNSKQLTIYSSGLLYKYILKPLFFRMNPETVHTRMVQFGEQIGRNRAVKSLLKQAFYTKQSILTQQLAGITFPSPIGLAAGFDYEARLTQVLSTLGFGFETIGTITNYPYEGNPKPLLGRLPKSRSLMVNKGFKNLGAQQTIVKLTGLSFDAPVGVSIGRTNARHLASERQSIADILHAFIRFEQSKVKHAYYELNISCPNLYGNVSFYASRNLKELLSQIDMLHIKRPIFVKMPIDKSDIEIKSMLTVISHHSPKGVIFGNLQKNRQHPSLDPKEVSKYQVGHFSGKPTFDRSNELIKLAYTHYKDRFTIIGCGGVFSAEDAYKKITLGASLVQLITGMIFVGPQLVAQINVELVALLKKDGFTHISQAVGKDA